MGLQITDVYFPEMEAPASTKRTIEKPGEDWRIEFYPDCGAGSGAGGAGSAATEPFVDGARYVDTRNPEVAMLCGDDGDGDDGSECKSGGGGGGGGDGSVDGDDDESSRPLRPPPLRPLLRRVFRDSSVNLSVGEFRASDFIPVVARVCTEQREAQRLLATEGDDRRVGGGGSSSSSSSGSVVGGGSSRPVLWVDMEMSIGDPRLVRDAAATRTYYCTLLDHSSSNHCPTTNA